MSYEFKFTKEEYIQCIEREQYMRLTTYPKIIKKMEKKGCTDIEIANQFNTQGIQNQRLQIALTGIESGKLESHVSVAYSELIRELDLRKKLYPFFVFKQIIRQDEADYQIMMWREICYFFADAFLENDEWALLQIDRPRKRKRNAKSL